MAIAIHTIEVTGISEETLHLLDEHDRQNSSDRSLYIRHLLDKDLRTPALSELLAPYREQVAESGQDEEQIGQLFSDAREEAYAGKIANE